MLRENWLVRIYWFLVLWGILSKEQERWNENQEKNIFSTKHNLFSILFLTESKENYTVYNKHPLRFGYIQTVEEFISCSW